MLIVCYTHDNERHIDYIVCKKHSPSQRAIVLPVKKTGKQVTAAATITGISNAIAGLETTRPFGAATADRPSTAKMLKILLLTILSTAISLSPRTLASTDVTASLMGKLIFTLSRLIVPRGVDKSREKEADSPPWGIVSLLLRASAGHCCAYASH